jgi:hypothetical protein
MPAARSARGKSAAEFHPRLPTIGDDGAPEALDFTWLSRLQTVERAGNRDLFRFGTAPHPARLPVPTPRSSTEPAIVSAGQGELIKEADPSPVVFYGYALRQGSAPSAFLLKDDEIHVMREGEPGRSRYRVIAFSPTVVTVEDQVTGDRRRVPILQPQ